MVGEKDHKGEPVAKFHNKQQGVTYRIGDTVLVRSEHGDKPFIGEIKEIGHPQGKSIDNVYAQWFYRPEEAAGGKKAFHGDQELYRSDHCDWIEGDTILSKCKVLSIAAFKELPHSERENVFYARWRYLAGRREFKPDKVPVFCHCNMPENPDVDMVTCAQCNNWYHTACLKLYEEDHDLTNTTWTCSRCNPQNGAT